MYWWHTPLIQALSRLKQEAFLKFETDLVYYRIENCTAHMSATLWSTLQLIAIAISLWQLV